MESCKKVEKSHLKRKAFISFFFFFRNISSASGGSNQDRPSISKCVYFHANMLVWIGVDD